MHKVILCPACEAEFTIKHNLDEDHYRVEYCPFCGDTLETDEDYEYDMDEDEDLPNNP